MIAPFIKYNLVYAIGMTIVHSLWQVALVYFIMRLTLKMLGTAVPEIKYKLAAYSLITTLVLSFVTFIIYYKPGPSGLVTIDQMLPLKGYAHHGIPGTTGAIRTPVLTGKSLSTILPWVVLMYFSGLALLSLRLLTGSFYLRTHRRKGVGSPAPEILIKFCELCKRAGVLQKVRLLESLIVKIPEVIGFLRPVIIVPAGFFANMPFDQAEVILAHELAHIRRHDFLFNIIQSVIEIIFFYHPAIYLISARIRNERENCCDDMALACCPGKETYARALATMAELRLSRSYPAVALMKGRQSLLERIKRILKQDTMKTKISDKLLAGVIILAGFGLLLVTGAAAMNKIGVDRNEGRKSVVLSLSQFKPGTAPVDSLVKIDERKVVIRQEDKKGNNHTYELQYKNDKLDLFRVDGKIIPESKYSHYKDVIARAGDMLTKTQTETAAAGAGKDSLDGTNVRINIEKIVKEIQKDTARNRREVEISVSRIDGDSLRQEMESVRQQLDKINFDSLKMTLRNSLTEEEMKKLQGEIDRAQKELNTGKIRIEIEKSRKAINGINADSLNIMIEKSLNGIDCDISTGLDSSCTHMKLELRQMNLDQVQKALDNIDWDSISPAAYAGLNSARLFLPDSTGLRMNIIHLPGLQENIENALKSIQSINLDSLNINIEESRQELEKAQENLERTLEELEQEKENKKP